MSRYWEGDGETPDVRFQPVMCQQCSHAPCEGVCPVLATYHNLDGLNAMIYNRCVGTRYCANNCPYSARRFNFHSFRWPESFNLMLNPDVLVREMGVMEKCTFCVQRIRAFKDDWRDTAGFAGEGKASTADYSRVAACAAACPTNAITFGNLKDEKSDVYAKFNDERTYRMLEELNTKPGVAYLTRIVHTDSQLHHGHGGGHGAEHGGHGDAKDASHTNGHDAPKHDSHNSKEKEHH
jgi:molybdopterin-containing oxidoreductase family iron-sulfur binding subunit